MRRIWRSLKDTRRSSTGAAAVEFAIVFPLLLFVILSMVDLGRLLIVQATLNSAAYEGARAAARSVSRLATPIQQATTAAFPAAIARLANPTNCSTQANGGCPSVVENTFACAQLSTGGASVVNVTAAITFTFFSPVGIQYFYGAGWGESVDLRVTAKSVCLD